MLDTWLSKYDPTQELAWQQPPVAPATLAPNHVVMVPWKSLEEVGPPVMRHVSCASVRLVHVLQKPFEPQSGSPDEHVAAELAGKDTWWCKAEERHSEGGRRLLWAAYIYRVRDVS
jgi:hypothetical protein